MASKVRVVGAAPNVDAAAAAEEKQPYEENVDERRVVSAYCCTCEEHETLLLEAGRRRPWEHDETHPSHVVEYWRVDDGE